MGRSFKKPSDRESRHQYSLSDTPGTPKRSPRPLVRLPRCSRPITACEPRPAFWPAALPGVFGDGCEIVSELRMGLRVIEWAEDRVLGVSGITVCAGLKISEIRCQCQNTRIGSFSFSDLT